MSEPIKANENKETKVVLADRLLNDACLDYSNDHRDRHARASRLLEENPELAECSIWCAAAVGDVGAAREFLDNEPGLRELKGRPRNWEPLLYACYSRVKSQNEKHSTLEVGRLLLERGANPNAVYWWRETACPSQKGSDPSKTKEGQTPFAIDTYAFTALTGVCGEGESGPVNQPRHRQWREFAELLLKHGARPDDNQALYNRMFGDDDELLELLLEEQGAQTTKLSAVDRLVSFCLGADRAAAQALLDANPDLMNRAPRDLLTRTASGNQLDAARLMLDLGFPVNAIDRTTALHQAGWHGRRELAEMLLAAGADLSIRDREHYATPGDWARHNGQNETAEYLNNIHLDLFEAIGNNLIDRIEGIVKSDPGSLERPFKEYHGNPPGDGDSLTPLAFARKRGWDKVATELERLGATG